MTKIVVERYRVSDLPPNLRQGLEPAAEVRITIESELAEAPRERIMSLDEMFALREPPYRTSEEIVSDIRRQRDDWDE